MKELINRRREENTGERKRKEEKRKDWCKRRGEEGGKETEWRR